MAGIYNEREERNKVVEAQAEEIKKAIERELRKRKLAVYRGNVPNFNVRCDRGGSTWRSTCTGNIRVQISHGREMKQFISKKDGSGIDIMAVVDFMAAVKTQKDADDAREKELRRLTADMEPIAKKLRKHFGISEYGVRGNHLARGTRRPTQALRERRGHAREGSAGARCPRKCRLHAGARARGQRRRARARARSGSRWQGR